MAKYNGSVELISGITPANGQDFPLVAAHAVQVDDDGTRLDEALKNVSTDIRKGKHRQVGKACLWYHNFYDWGNTDDEAAANLAQNDIVVAGGNLYANAGTKEDRTRQLNIITKAKNSKSESQVVFLYNNSILEKRRRLESHPWKRWLLGCQGSCETSWSSQNPYEMGNVPAT